MCVKPEKWTKTSLMFRLTQSHRYARHWLLLLFTWTLYACW